jgi:hypothetical protein
MPSKKKAISRSRRKRPAQKPPATGAVFESAKPLDPAMQLQWANQALDRAERRTRQALDERDGLLHLIAVADRHHAITRIDMDGESL